MPAPQRQHDLDLIALVVQQPYRFQFTQLLNVLLRLLRRQGVPYDHAFGTVLRFKNSVSLAFPASEIEALEIEAAPHLARAQAASALHDATARKIRITPAFIGLLGISGTLPLHDTDRLAARQWLDGDASQRDLLDVFSNRMIGLFYEAWGKYRVEHGIDTRGHDRLLPLLTALAGWRRAPHHRHRVVAAGPVVPDETIAFYAGLLRTRPVSAATIERVLADYFKVPVRLEQFAGCWDPIPEQRRSTLGSTRPKLGCGAVLGVRLWRHDLLAQLHVGPLAAAQVPAFLPGGDARRALQHMLHLFDVPSLRFAVRLLLAPAYIKRMVLTTNAAPMRLGWNTFLTSTPGVVRDPTFKSMLSPAAQRGDAADCNENNHLVPHLPRGNSHDR